VRAQWMHPDPFADPRRYLTVRADNPRLWSAARNHLNHPAFYYLLLAPLAAVGDGVLATRLANVAIATAALALAIAAGWRSLADTRARIAFAVIAASFPKAALIAGMINNDNLSALAGAMVFAGLAGLPAAEWLIAGGLVVAGWAKLTTLVAMAAVVGAHATLGGPRAIVSRRTALAIAAAVLGFLPYVVMRVTTGAFVPVNLSVYRAPLAARPHWDAVTYAAEFGRAFVLKWPAAEASLPLAVAGLLIAAALGMAAAGAVVAPAQRRLVGAFLIATLVTFAIHLGFGWQAFRTYGDMTIAQTRYYNVLWPGIALGGAALIGRLAYRTRAWPGALLVYLVPTVIAGALIALA